MGAQPPWGGLAKASEARWRDISTQTLRKGLAKAAEARRVNTGAQPPWGGLAKAVEAHQRDIGTQPLRRGLAKAAEACYADIGAQHLKRGLAGNLFSTGCTRAHLVGVASEPAANWGVGESSSLVLVN